MPKKFRVGMENILLKNSVKIWKSTYFVVFYLQEQINVLG